MTESSTPELPQVDGPDGRSFPSVRGFLLEEPLYEYWELPGEWEMALNKLRFFDGTIDTQCPYCGKDSIFRRYRGYSQQYYRAENGLKPHQFSVTWICQRSDDHTIYALFQVQGNGAVGKIGQYPSLADLHTGEVAKYRRVLNARYAEFTRAIGLAAHGIGIGSFVYLRRVFESLIEEAHAQARTGDGWDEEAYFQSRMDERIRILANWLPRFLVENRSLYSILSKGVHELDEQECLKHFATVRVGIELILDEKLAEEQRREKLADATKAIADVNQELKAK